jgi:Tfp pilus assembly protein PilN
LSTRTATAIAAAALIGALLISYLTDLALAHRLSGLVEQHKLEDLKAHRDTRQIVSTYRPDVLALLKEINTMIPASEGTVGQADRGDPSGQGPGNEPADRPFRGRGGRADPSGQGPGSSGSGAIVLDSLTFRRGQAIQIDGQADRPEQLYAFEQTLQKKEGIRNVEIKKSVKDNQTNKVRFTMSFQYKTFTQKGAR